MCVLVVPSEGESQLLQKMLQVALSTSENYILKLYQSNTTPTSSTSKTSFTEANFTGYAARTLTRANWSNAIINGSNAAVLSYGTSPQSWTCGTTGNTIYGYCVEGATSTNVLWAERFGTTRTLASSVYSKHRVSLSPMMVTYIRSGSPGSACLSVGFWSACASARLSRAPGFRPAQNWMCGGRLAALPMV
jgi:hypothetical protein